MNKKFIIILFSIVCSFNMFAQTTDSVADAAAAEKAEGKKAVRDPWACNVIVDNQTTNTNTKGSMEFMIHHRFANFSQGLDNLYGIYGSSNIRLGITYAVTDKIMIGFGSEKDNKQQEFTGKVKFLDQNRAGSVPVSVALFGNACINTNKKETWGDGFKFDDKLSYFGQLMVSRKFSDRLTFQVAGCFSHFNKVESNKNKTVKITTDTVAGTTTTATTVTYKNKYANEAFGVSCGGRFKFYNEMSLVAEYNQPLLNLDFTKVENSDILKPKPNLVLGVEVATSTHAFQIFVASSKGITAQNNFVKNQVDYTDAKQLLIGFNITVRLN
ncbi:MAG: DUF5777 family beta-barrel protein [Bacteroidota bacterium]